MISMISMIWYSLIIAVVSWMASTALFRESWQQNVVFFVAFVASFIIFILEIYSLFFYAALGFFVFYYLNKHGYD